MKRRLSLRGCWVVFRVSIERFQRYHPLCLFALFPILSSEIAYAQNAVMKDPTRPAVQEVALKPTLIHEEFTLQSIIIAPDRRLAVINGKVLKYGDKLGNVTVKKINKNSVTLLGGGREVVVYLFTQPNSESPK